MPVLVKVNPAIWQQLIVAQSNLQSWVATVHKHDMHVHGFPQFETWQTPCTVRYVCCLQLLL